MPLFGWLRTKRQSSGITAPINNQEDSFQWLGERRHMANVPYVLPKDEQEISRLDFQHYMLRYILQSNYLAPIQQPKKILDVGCGTGRWATEMAEAFPEAQVFGVDVVDSRSPQKTDASGARLLDLSKDFIFKQGNVLEGLPFPDNTFDFVHMRLLLFAVPAEHWPRVLRELLRVTRPGGWIESIETGPQQECGPAMEQIVAWITEASYKRGIDPLLGPKIGGLLQAGGLANAQTRTFSVPVGAYGGRIGSMAQTDVFGVVNGVKQMVVAQGITNAASYEAMMQQAINMLPQYQGKLPFYAAYGQK